MPPSFTEKKTRIIQQLDVPESEYNDLSPKGSIDAGIRQLIDEINAIPTLVTTSSCAGRVSVYLEGQKSSVQPSKVHDSETIASSGGKGGGKWLFVSHDPVSTHGNLCQLLGLKDIAVASSTALAASARLLHFKFEAMVRKLHLSDFLLIDTVSDTAPSNCQPRRC
jgi:tRNA wybutosine-synthesizing protein 3